MKRSTLTKVLSILVIAFAFVACNKYEEGANFSLISAKSRFANEWTMVSTISSASGISVDITGTLPDTKYNVSKEGTYTVTYAVGSLTTTDSGTWAFNSDKTQVTMTDSDGDATTLTFIKLKNKELKVSTVDNGVTLTSEFTGL